MHIASARHGYVPRGITVKLIGIVSKAFLPYLSERLPTKGIITRVPSPVICIIKPRMHAPVIFQINHHLSIKITWIEISYQTLYDPNKCVGCRRDCSGR